MSSLLSFPAPPGEGFITVCERNAELVTSQKADCDVIQSLGYPEINACQDLMYKPCISKETARSAFLEHNDSQKKRLLTAWYEHGLSGVLEELAEHAPNKGAGGAVGSACRTILGLLRWATSLHGSVFPHLAMSPEDLIAEFSPNPAWRTGTVRCFAWHPHTVKFAVALRDDSIKVFCGGGDSSVSGPSGAHADVVPVLKHKMQRRVADIAWRPMSASHLAVGCQTGVLLWNIDPMSLSTRPSSGAVVVLSAAGHSPVTSVAWCPQGALLVSASPTDSAILVWDVLRPAADPVTLRRVGGGVATLQWSPDASKLLAAGPTNAIRVWETKTWTCEKWTKLTGRCQAACWSPCGEHLLFSTSDSPTVFALTFPAGGGLGGSKVAVAVADLSTVAMETNDGGATVSVGGRVQAMAWDAAGERLALAFSGGAAAELIAVFQTRLDPLLTLIPCGFVRGAAGEIPHLVTFQPKFEPGALLTTVWSSGRVAHVPMHFLRRAAVTAGATGAK